jgi:proteasome lid subunit RPN8/RPN11
MSRETVVLAAGVRAAMMEHAGAWAPDEACGLLAADAAGTIRHAYRLDNVARSPVRYTIDPEGHVRSLHDADARGWNLAGVFHSHPDSPSRPSPRDVAEALDSLWLYVIVGDPPEWTVRGYRIVAGVVTEVSLVDGS